MRRQLFIPARNSRHRIAVLSLYRALLRAATKIPLPDDWKESRSKVAIRRVVKNGFAKNRAYTSLRLVYASMAAGYKFLSLFSRARDPVSPENAEFVDHLQPRLDKSVPVSRACSVPQRTGRTPFLIKTSADSTPKYAASVAASQVLATKKGKPNLCSTAYGQPFIRLIKPQPRALSKMVGRKNRIFEKKVRTLVEIDERWREPAALEDDWDNLVIEQMRRERSPALQDNLVPQSRDASTESYSWTAQLSRLWLEWQVERTWRDWIARGEALHEFMQKHAPQPPETVPEDAPLGEPVEKFAGSPPSALPEVSNIVVRKDYASRLSAAIEAQLGTAATTKSADKVVDPFVQPAWSALVRAETGRMHKWISKYYSQRNVYE